jgi:hypothetical protein
VDTRLLRFFALILAAGCALTAGCASRGRGRNADLSGKLGGTPSRPLGGVMERDGGGSPVPGCAFGADDVEESQLVWLDRELARYVEALQTPGGLGDVQESRDSAGRLTRIQYDDADGDGDFVDTLTYDGSGRLIRYDHSEPNGDGDFVDTFTYDGSGRLIRYDHSEPNGDGDFADTLSYDGSGRLIRYDHSEQNGDGDFADSFTYDGDGQVIRYDHSEPNGDGDFAETFTYDGEQRVTRFERTGGSSELTKSYDHSDC